MFRLLRAQTASGSPPFAVNWYPRLSIYCPSGQLFVPFPGASLKKPVIGSRLSEREV